MVKYCILLNHTYSNRIIFLAKLSKPSFSDLPAAFVEWRSDEQRDGVSENNSPSHPLPTTAKLYNPLSITNDKFFNVTELPQRE